MVCRKVKKILSNRTYANWTLKWNFFLLSRKINSIFGVTFGMLNKTAIYHLTMILCCRKEWKIDRILFNGKKLNALDHARNKCCKKKRFYRIIRWSIIDTPLISNCGTGLLCKYYTNWLNRLTTVQNLFRGIFGGVFDFQHIQMMKICIYEWRSYELVQEH